MLHHQYELSNGSLTMESLPIPAELFRHFTTEEFIAKVSKRIRLEEKKLKKTRSSIVRDDEIDLVNITMPGSGMGLQVVGVPYRFVCLVMIIIIKNIRVKYFSSYTMASHPDKTDLFFLAIKYKFDEKTVEKVMNASLTDKERKKALDVITYSKIRFPAKR